MWAAAINEPSINDGDAGARDETRIASVSCEKRPGSAAVSVSLAAGRHRLRHGQAPGGSAGIHALRAAPRPTRERLKETNNIELEVTILLQKHENVPRIHPVKAPELELDAPAIADAAACFHER